MNKFKLVLPILLLANSFFFVWGQRHGGVEIIADPRVADLVDMHILFNQKSQTIPGYRIMIAALSGNNSKSGAFKIKNTFLSNYENVDAYLSFEEPNFKVKVGDFKTRLEAFCFLQKIKSNYPSAFIIKDNVYPYKLKIDNIIEGDDLDE